jgi:glycine cleavage system H protein
MDGFTYSNIFDTKGIEYLAIIAFLVLLIPFWIVLNRRSTLKQGARRVLGILSANILRIPQGIFFSRNHTWTHLERSGNARVGLDDLLIHLTGEMNFISLRTPGETIRKGELLAEFEQEGKLLRIFSPISGSIVNVNQSLAEEPGLLTDDPYGDGWLYRIRPTDWKAETASCYLAGETADWLKNELDRFKDFLAGSVKHHSPGNMIVLQDGGELRDHTLAALPHELWQDFQKEFLDPDETIG